MTDVTIESAIMSVQHSFIVDNWNDGARLGTLTVFGAIAQKFRGPVGTSAPSGYTKTYNYDDRMHYRNPPAFLDALTAAWDVVRVTSRSRQSDGTRRAELPRPGAARLPGAQSVLRGRAYG